jgi:hypothetical protein
MRTVPFGDVLDFVATKMQGTAAPMNDEAAAFCTYINDAVRNCWEREFWPELMVIEERYYRPEWDVATTYAEGDEVYVLDADTGDPVYYRALTGTLAEPPVDFLDTIWEEATDLLRYITLDGDVTPAVQTIPGGGTVTDLDDLVLSVAQLQALNVSSASAGTLRLVYDATYGLGSYRLRTGTDAEVAPTIYRPNNYASLTAKVVWEKVL